MEEALLNKILAKVINIEATMVTKDEFETKLTEAKSGLLDVVESCPEI